MLPNYFDYIFVHQRQYSTSQARIKPKFLSTLGPNPARTRTQPEKPGPTCNFDVIAASNNKRLYSPGRNNLVGAYVKTTNSNASRVQRVFYYCQTTIKEKSLCLLYCVLGKSD